MMRGSNPFWTQTPRNSVSRWRLISLRGHPSSNPLASRSTDVELPIFMKERAHRQVLKLPLVSSCCALGAAFRLDPLKIGLSPNIPSPTYADAGPRRDGVARSSLSLGPPVCPSSNARQLLAARRP